MAEFFGNLVGCVKLVIICASILFALVVILLALPRSRFRYFFFELLGWLTASTSTVLLVSPIDALPFIPVDDVGYGIAAVTGGVMAYLANRGRHRLEE